jgi:hypothetical protein
MHRMKRLAFVLWLLVLVSVCAITDQLFAQHWQKIGDFKWSGVVTKNGAVNAPQITALCFINERRGLVAVSTYFPNLAVGFVPEIFLTTDKGVTWVLASLPSDIQSQSVLVQDIYMQDSLIGFAATNHRTPFFGAIWKTIDGGKSWTAIPNSPPCSAIRPMSGSRFATSGGGAALKNPMEALVTPAVTSPTTFPSYTHDAGTNWYQSLTPIREAWGVYYDHSNDRFYICPEHEENPAMLTGSIYSSADFGTSWQRINGLPNGFGSTGEVKGNGDAIYVQSSLDYRAGITGVWRTIDGGNTFKSVGGPSSFLDSRFSVPTSCAGNVVLACDSTSLWITTDGGDGTLGSSILDLVVQSPSKVSSCGSDSIILQLANAGCYPIFLKSIIIDDAEFFTLQSPLILPDTLAQGSRDSFKIAFHPHLRQGTHTVHVHLTGRLGEDSTGAIYDSVITLSISAIPQRPVLTSSTYLLDAGDVSICGGIDTIIILRNAGCDTLTIDSLSGVLGKELALSGFVLPLRLPPDSSVRVSISIVPSSLGALNRDLVWHTSQQGLTGSLDLQLRANGVITSGRAILGSTSLNAGSFSYCVGDTIVTSLIKDAGCDSLAISNVRLTGSAAFTLLSPTKDTSLAADSVCPIRLRFKPSQKGPSSALLTFHLKSIRGSDPGHDTTLTLIGSGLGGTKSLSVSNDHFELGSIYACQNADTAFVIENFGCDTLTVLSGQFDNVQYSTNATLPLRLLPGASSSLNIHLSPDTAGHPSIISTTYALTSDADSAQNRTIHFAAHLIYPIKLRLELTKIDSAIAGASVNFHLALLGDRPKGVSALHFDLAHDDDLLSFRRFTGSGLSLDNSKVTNGAMVQSFSYSPLVDTGAIGDLNFGVFLSKNSATSLTLSNVRFDSPIKISLDCIAAINDSGAGFRYLYRCGDSLVQMELRSERLHISNISPNPASRKLIIQFSGPLPHPAHLELFGLLGERVFETFSASSSTVLDLGNIPIGAYYLRCSSTEMHESRRLVLIR